MSNEPREGDLPSVLRLAKQTVVSPDIQSGDPLDDYAIPLALDEVRQESGTTVQTEAGGFTGQKRHLDAMRKRIEVCVYEPLQNLSYGLGYRPQPAVIFGLKDGRRVIYDGIPAHAPAFGDVAYQSFVTACTDGITPATAVHPIHFAQQDASGDRPTLGFFGEGLKNAVTYLLTTYPESRIEINSSYVHGKTGKTHAWVGRYNMRDMVDGRLTQLAIDHADVDPKRVPQTSTTFYEPPREFFEATINASQTFLFMNQHYRGGIFVPGNHDFNSGITHQALVKGLGMEVLDPELLFDTVTKDPVGYGFMDGQRFTLETDASRRDAKGKFFYVWHFVGGLEDDTASEAQIQRGRDSAQIEGLDKFPSLLRTATNSGHLGVDFWVNLFEKMYADNYVVDLNSPNTTETRVVPYELKDRDSYFSAKFDARGQKTIYAAWKQFSESHPDIEGVANDENDINNMRRLRRSSGATQSRKIMMTHGLYYELKSICADIVHDATDITRSDVNTAIEMAPPLELIENVTLGRYFTGKLNTYEAVFRAIGENFDHITLSTDSSTHALILTFDDSIIAPMYIPSNIAHSLFLGKDVLAVLTELISIKEQGKPMNIKRTEITGIEVNLNADFETKDEFTSLIVNGAARKMNRNPTATTIEVTIPIPAKEFRTIRETATKEFNATRVKILEQRDEEAKKQRKIERQLAEEKERNQQLASQLDSLMSAIRGDEALSKDAAVKAALLQAEESKKKLEDLLRRRRIELKEAVEFQLAQLWDLRKYALKATAGLAAGGGVLKLAKDTLLPWALNNTAIKNGLAVVGSVLSPIDVGLRLPTILGLNEYVPVVQTGENGIGLGWTIYDNFMLIDADNEPRKVTIRSVWPKFTRESDSPASEHKILPRAIPLVALEGMDPTVDTSGYYMTSFTNTLEVVWDLNGGHVTGSYKGDVEYKIYERGVGRPSTYLSRQVYTPTMPDNTWTPIAVRPGEMPLRYSGAETTAQFRQNLKTGGWEVKMSRRNNSRSLIVYTTKADEQELQYLKRKPEDADIESLLDRDSLRPDIRDAIAAARRSDLSEEEKIEEGLAIWRQVYRYDRVADKNSFPQTDAKKYVSAMINQGIGPCGYAALGAIAILREIGIPANAVGGFLNESYGQELDLEELHAWIIVWNKTAQAWKYIEPQNGLSTQRYKDEKNSGVYQSQPTIVPPIAEQKSPNLPVSVNMHVQEQPEPIFAGIIQGPDEQTNTQRNAAGIPGINQTLEEQILSYIASEDATRRRREILIAAAPVFATAIAPSLVDMLRLLIIKRKQIRDEVDAEIAAEKSQPV